MENGEQNNANNNAENNNNLDQFQNLANDLFDEKELAGTKEPDNKVKKDENQSTQTNNEGKDDKASDDKQEENQEGNEEPEAVEVDGKQYKLDADGNALSEDGKVFKTKAELDKMSEDDSTETFIESLIKNVGIIPKDEKGNPIVYQDTEEDIIRYNNDVSEIRAAEKNREFINSDPDVKRLYEHKRRGGTLDDFITKTNNSWQRVKFDATNEDQLKSIIISEQMQAGASKERAQQTADMYKDTGKLKEFAQEAYNTLVKKEKAIEENEIKIAEQREKEEIENNIKYWENTKAVINQGKIGNILIPQADREPFFAYMAIPVNKDGYSKEQLDELTEEQSLLMKYWKYKGFDMSKIVATAVKNEKVKNLRERITGQKGLGEGHGIDKNKHAKVDDLDINLKTVMTGKR